MTSSAASDATPGHPARWEERWASNNTGWDQGGAHPALVSLLSSESGSDGRKGADELGIKRDGRALVPGCGMGYDVALFAQRGLHTTGLDIAPTGVAAARQYLAKAALESAGKLDKDKMAVEQANFFAYDPEDKFDVILDYTFLCALPPALRPAWSTQMTHLAAPACRLITLMFPLYPLPSSSTSSSAPAPASSSSPTSAPPGTAQGQDAESNLPTTGPPYALTEKIYHQLLDAHWELIYLESVDGDRSKGGGRRKGPEGGEKVGVWKRR